MIQRAILWCSLNHGNAKIVQILLSICIDPLAELGEHLFTIALRGSIDCAIVALRALRQMGRRADSLTMKCSKKCTLYQVAIQRHPPTDLRLARVLLTGVMFPLRLATRIGVDHCSCSVTRGTATSIAQPCDRILQFALKSPCTNIVDLAAMLLEFGGSPRTKRIAHGAGDGTLSGSDLVMLLLRFGGPKLLAKRENFSSTPLHRNSTIITQLRVCGADMFESSELSDPSPELQARQLVTAESDGCSFVLIACCVFMVLFTAADDIRR